MIFKLGNIDPSSEVRSFLSENDYCVTYSLKQKVYYQFARSIMPIAVRRWLQKNHSKKITHRDNFIYEDLVALLKLNSSRWADFIDNLYPSNFTSSIILTHDVETEEGLKFIPKVIELEKKYGFISSWNIVPYKYPVHREITDEILHNNNEIGIHGYNHDGKLYYSKKIFDYRAKGINDALKKYDAVGFRSPMVHRNLEWLQQLNILYDASCFDYDPYQPFPGGTGCIWPYLAGRFVELPYTLPQDHVLFYTLGKKDIAIWKHKIKWLVENHGMILALTHPDYLMEKNHLSLYEELLSNLQEIKNSWICLPRELASYTLNKPEQEK